jgi:hypothetical protein
MVQVAVTVANVPVVPTPTTEVAAGAIGRYSGIDMVYQTLASWTVAAGKTGELKEILILSNIYTLTSIQITIAGVVYKTAWIMLSAMPLIFEDLKLAAGAVVLVEVLSTTGAAIVVDCTIVGKEIG